MADDIRESIYSPEITEFSPSSGSAGTEITVKGNYLATVDVAYIGDVRTQILNRVSNSEILLKVIGNEISGPITLTNSVVAVESAESFSMAHIVPSISSISPDVTGFHALDLVKISGSNLKSVLGFYFGEVQAQVEFLNDTNAEITVPYVADSLGSQAKIRLQYYGPGSEEYVQSAKTYNMLKRDVVLSGTSVDVVSNIITITLSGEQLDVISQVFFGETELTILSHTAGELVGTMPKGELSGVVTEQLSIVDKYARKIVLVEGFVITIP